MSERTPQDVLREAVDAALHELGVPDESYPAPVANAVRILQDALDKAIAEAPDSPRHGPAIWGDYGVTCACTAVLDWPPGWARNEIAAGRLTEKHAKELAAPDTLSEKPGLDPRPAFTEDEVLGINPLFRENRR